MSHHDPIQNMTISMLSGLLVDRTSAIPMFRQLCDGLCQAIRAGQFVPGARLPSTRALAQHLGISRNTIHTAFEQLIAEGYLEGRQGAGTYVAQSLPEQLLRVDKNVSAPAAQEVGTRPVSQRTAKLLDIYPQAPWGRTSIDAVALSAYSIETPQPPALVLGYTGLSERAIKYGVRRLFDVLG